MLTKVLPPFMFPCDFTHQLGREGSRKPFQPAFRVLVKVLGGSPGLHISSLCLGRCGRLRTEFLGTVTVLIDGVCRAGKGAWGREGAQPALHV